LPFPPRNQCHTETIISVKLETLHYIYTYCISILQGPAGFKHIVHHSGAALRLGNLHIATLYHTNTAC